MPSRVASSLVFSLDGDSSSHTNKGLNCTKSGINPVRGDCEGGFAEITVVHSPREFEDVVVRYWGLIFVQCYSSPSYF
jgi:hypothetical protein